MLRTVLFGCAPILVNLIHGFGDSKSNMVKGKGSPTLWLESSKFQVQTPSFGPMWSWEWELLATTFLELVGLGQFLPKNLLSE